MQVTPVKRIAIPAQIVQQIQSMVQSGELEPQDKLPSERELCEQFSASRSAVREAISALIFKGVLERRNKGIYVCEFDSEIMAESVELLIITKKIPIKDVLEARTVIEIESAGLAAQRATEEDLAFLLQCINTIEEPTNSEAAVRAAATDFHRGLAKATHNPLIEDFFMVLSDSFVNDPRSIDILHESANSHRDIFQMLERRDADGARKAMRKHLEIVKKTY